MGIAQKMAPIVSFLIKLLYPVAYPLSRYLDWQFGEHHDKKRFNRKDLKTLIQLHQNPEAPEQGKTLNQV